MLRSAFVLFTKSRSTERLFCYPYFYLAGIKPNTMLLDKQKLTSTDFQNVMPPSDWICIVDGGLHAFDYGATNRWSADFYAFLTTIAQDKKLCFVYVGGEIDYEISAKKLSDNGFGSFPFISEYKNMQNVKSFLRFARAVITNNSTLHRFALECNVPCLVVLNNSLETCDSGAETKLTTERMEISEWLTQHWVQ